MASCSDACKVMRYNEKMSSDLHAAFLRLSKQNRELFSTELNAFLHSLGPNVAKDYWQANKGRLLLDQREKRHLSVPITSNVSAPALSATTAKTHVVPKVASPQVVAPVSKPAMATKARIMPRLRAAVLPMQPQSVKTSTVSASDVSLNVQRDTDDDDIVPFAQNPSKTSKPSHTKTKVAMLSTSQQINLYTGSAFDPQVAKAEKKAKEEQDTIVKLLKDKAGVALDPVTGVQRVTEPHEVIYTAYPEGGYVKEQRADGISFIVRKAQTLVYYEDTQNNTRQCFYVSPEQAETMDDQYPFRTSYIDGPASKRAYKFVYSVRNHKELYQYLADILPG